MRGTRRGAVPPAALAFLLTTSLLAGCGGGSGAGTGAAGAATTTTTPATTTTKAGLAALPTAEIVRRADVALRKATSVRLRSSFMDVRVTRDGGKGWIRQRAGGPRAEVLVVGDRTFVRGRAFWLGQGKDGPLLARTFGDRWVESSAPSGAGVRVAPMTVEGVADSFVRALRHKHAFTDTVQTTASGFRVVRLIGAAGRLDVAADGEPYPLRLDAHDDRLDLTFSDYDRPVALRVPKDAVTGDGRP